MHLGLLKRRLSGGVQRVQVCATCDQQFGDRCLPTVRGGMQRRRTPVIVSAVSFDLRSGVQEQGGEVCMAFPRSVMQ